MISLPRSRRKNCIYCGGSFDVTENSKEHIIPNTLGGIRTRKFLLCKKCNRELGDLDKILKEGLAYFTNFYHIAQDRKLVIHKFEGTTPNGDKIIIGKNGYPEFHKKVIKTSDNQETIRSYHPGSAKKIADSMTKKNKNKEFSNSYTGKSKPIKIIIPFEDPEFIKGIIKIYFVAVHLFDDNFKEIGILKNYLKGLNISSQLIVTISRYNDFLPFPLTHGVIVAYNYDNSKQILGLVILYNICYLIFDPNEFKGKFQCSAYFMNPITKEDKYFENFPFKQIFPPETTVGMNEKIELFNKELLTARIYCEIQRFFDNINSMEREMVYEEIYNEIIRGTSKYPNNLALNNIKDVLAECKFEKKKEILTRALNIWNIA